MATVPRTMRIKIPTSRANGAREIGQPGKGQSAARKSRSLDSASSSLLEGKAPLGMTKGGNGATGKNRGLSSASEAGRFGVYGGRYVPETLMAALEELEQSYAQADADPAFPAELDGLLRYYC